MGPFLVEGVDELIELYENRAEVTSLAKPVGSLQLGQLWLRRDSANPAPATNFGVP
jgi:hypothetical protein